MQSARQGNAIGLLLPQSGSRVSGLGGAARRARPLLPGRFGVTRVALRATLDDRPRSFRDDLLASAAHLDGVVGGGQDLSSITSSAPGQHRGTYQINVSGWMFLRAPYLRVD